MIVSSRRGAAPTGPVPAPVEDRTYYVSSVPGGRADLEVSVVGGAAQPLVAATGRSLELMTYAEGLVPTMDEGFGWDGSGVVGPPYAQLVAQEWFETYALGGISGGAIAGGTGWNGTGGLATVYVQQVAGESFETYALGGSSGSSLMDGTGWNGSAALISY